MLMAAAIMALASERPHCSWNWFGSVDRALVCGLKSPRFDSGQGHVPWLWVHPQLGVCKRLLVNVSLSSTFLALCPSLFKSEWHCCHSYFKKKYVVDFLKRKRERDKESETSMREKHHLATSCMPPTGDVPTTKVHALNWNQTWHPSVCKLILYSLSQTG